MKHIRMLLPLFVACAAKPVSGPNESRTSANTPASSIAGETEQPSRTEQLVRAICAEHPPPCRMIEGEEHDAGKDAEGRALWVVGIDPDEEPDESEGQHAEVENAEGEDDEDADDYAEDHETREYWAGVFDDGRLVSHTQVTTASFQREDHDPDAVEESTSVEIAENRLQVVSGAYRAGRDWRHETVYRLSPSTVIYEANRSGYAGSSASSEERWDALAFRGGNFTSWVVCDEKGSPSGEERVVDRAHLYIPLMSLPAGYREGGWKTISPGPCAVSLEAANALRTTEQGLYPLDEMTVPAGFLTHGAPDNESDSAMRVLMGDSRTLYVEVHDDTWATAGKNWLHTDHLEIWLGPPSEAFGYDVCVRNQRSRDVVQWGVRMDSGAVISAYGKPQENPTVEVAAPAHPDAPARLAIVLPDMKYDSITVVYSDSDDGAGQDYLLATSALRHGVADSLGTSSNEGARGKSCIMGANGLERID